MIVIFCDGSSIAQNHIPYVGVGVMGFYANEDGIIQKPLFSIKSEFSGIYAPYSVHEDFALIKALQYAKRYLPEQVVICNDCMTYVNLLKERKIWKTKNQIRTLIWDSCDLSILNRREIDFEVLPRQCIGIRLTDIISKRYINRDHIESDPFQKLSEMMIGTHYKMRVNVMQSEKLHVFNDNQKAEYESVQHKPKKIITQIDTMRVSHEKSGSKAIKLISMKEYFDLHPELYEAPPRLSFSFA
jgi:ribonuclease HI